LSKRTDVRNEPRPLGKHLCRPNCTDAIIRARQDEPTRRRFVGLRLLRCQRIRSTCENNCNAPAGIVSVSSFSVPLRSGALHSGGAVSSFRNWWRPKFHGKYCSCPFRSPPPQPSRPPRLFGWARRGWGEVTAAAAVNWNFGKHSPRSFLSALFTIES
jgi:hypothetical protein